MSLRSTEQSVGILNIRIISAPADISLGGNMDATIAAISTARRSIVPKTEKKIFVQSSAIPFIMDLSMMEKKL